METNTFCKIEYEFDYNIVYMTHTHTQTTKKPSAFSVSQIAHRGAPLCEKVDVG
jgi:hypothetical protein